MLTSKLGIRLNLLLGKTVPVPASYEVMTALTQVTVTNDAQQQDGFQMTFALSKENAIDYGLVTSSFLQPFSRAIIGVLLGASLEILIDGVVEHHQLTPSNEPGMSLLTVTGRDVSTMLNLEEKNEEYPNQSDSLIITQIINGYAQYGLIPQITPTTDVPIEVQRIPRQHETDLQLIQRLAHNNGFVFYIEPLSLGSNRAYWGPEIRGGVSQPALTINLGASTNVKSLNFSNDALAPVGTAGSFVEPISKTSLPIPLLPSLRVPPLVPSPTPAKRRVLMRNTAHQSPLRAATAAIAREMQSPDSVTGQGELETVRYGHVLRARKLVDVRGVGFDYNGTYYVRRVTHTLSKENYTQSFSLSREGKGALLPTVRPS